MTDPAATDRVRDEWGRRVEAEYRSAALTHHFVLWLIQLGASPDLVHDGLRIVADELAHSELSHQVLLDAGGHAPPAIDRDTLALARTEGALLESDVLRIAMQIFCLGETVAVPLFSHLRAGCTVPAARRALDRILRDEVRHRDFGWDTLDWILETPWAGEVAPQLDSQLAGMFRTLERSYGDDGLGTDVITEAERAWGLAPAHEYAAILQRTFTRDWLPRFGERGYDPSAAWNARK